MNQEQSASIVDFVSAADNRTVSEETYAAWHLIIGHLDYEVATKAALLALQDETIRWVEPRTIISKVHRLKDLHDQELRRAKALSEPEPKRGVPVPVCLDHGISIMKCDPCSKKAVELCQRLGGVDSPDYQREFYLQVATTSETF